MIVDFLNLWRPPYLVLYVALDDFAGYEAGRYESPAIDDFEDLRYFLFQFQEFFEDDARHNLWIYAPTAKQQIIYDRHEILYLYGDDGRILSMLLERGFSHARPQLPAPHCHHYHHEFTSTHEELMESWDWYRKPLQPGDDD